MPTTVSTAFTQFRKAYVDLDALDVSKARTSRDNLKAQITYQASVNTDFPPITNKFIDYGSFARRTKITPLNDIDMMVLLNGDGTYQQTTFAPYTLDVIARNSYSPLWRYVNQDATVNSTRVLNSLKDGLTKVSHYRKADVKKTMQAVVLNLSSYSWVFDVVPALAVGSLTGQVTHHLIPDGKGRWLSTNPFFDQALVTQRNQQHNQNFLMWLRLLKYWNYRTHKPRLSSFYFEVLCIKVFAPAQQQATLQNALHYYFTNAPAYLLLSCPSPSGHGAALDRDVSATDKLSIHTAMITARDLASEAITLEIAGNHAGAIAKWKVIFGPSFPDYS